MENYIKPSKLKLNLGLTAAWISHLLARLRLRLRRGSLRVEYEDWPAEA